MAARSTTLFILFSALPVAASADPSLECSIGASTQVEISACLAEAEVEVDKAVELAFGFAMNTASELDDVTGRANAVPALENGQTAWSIYRDAHCEYVGSTFGGGSGTGIAVRSCRIELGRARMADLMVNAR